MDQQLALSLSRLDLKVKSTENVTKEDIEFMAIEENPFYEPYKSTDLYLWKKETDLNQLKLKSLKKKNILRKPILQRLQGQSQSLGTKWLKNYKLELESEVNWVNFSDIKKPNRKRAYSLNDLQTECEKISSGEIDNDSYFVPKRMSEMAKTMYIMPNVR